TADLYRGAARGMLDVQERSTGLLQEVGGLQVARSLHLDTADLHRGARCHADVGPVGKLDAGVAAGLGGNLVTCVQRLPGDGRVLVHGGWLNRISVAGAVTAADAWATKNQ